MLLLRRFSTVRLYCVLVVLFKASCTWTVKVAIPDVVGVPVIAPVDVPSARPPGKAPPIILKVYGDVPPEAVIVWVYAVPATAFGSWDDGENVICDAASTV